MGRQIPLFGFQLRLRIPCAILTEAQESRAVDENDLIRRLRNADVEAFRDLFHRYQPMVFRRCLFQTRDEEAAHDIVQETFERIWKMRAQLRPELSFLALCFRISGNLVKDAARRRRTQERLRESIPKPVPSEGDDPAQALELATLQERVRIILERDLGERCRTVFLLSRFERMSTREIAGILGIREKTVENQIAHALKVLRRKLADFA